MTTPEAIESAVSAGAAWLGFVFFAKSPRHLTMEAARTLAAQVPDGVGRVALTVDAEDTLLDAVEAAIAPTLWQLHGHETPARVAAVREARGTPVMKSIGIGAEADLARIADYATVADRLLIDAKPAPGADLPGGNGLTFDWRLIAGRDWPRPWMLAGGLTAETVATAVELTGAASVDVSSGVEAAPGRKDPARIRAFIAAAHAA